MTVYMSEIVRDDEGGIVLVDKTRFIKLWQNMLFKQTPELSYGDKAAWRADSKFNDAEKAFQKSLNTPIPLAEVTYCEYWYRQPVLKSYWYFFKKKVYQEIFNQECSFSNGITRTIWLFANDVEAFPVRTYTDFEAEMLAEYAGVTPDSYYTFVELRDELNLA